MNDEKNKYKDCPREVKITEELKDGYGRPNGKEEFKLNSVGNLIYSFTWDEKGQFVCAVENKYDKSGKIKKSFYKTYGKKGCSEYFYNKKGVLIREESLDENSITYDKVEITYKYKKDGSVKNCKMITTSHDENGNVIDVDEYEEGEDCDKY